MNGNNMCGLIIYVRLEEEKFTRANGLPGMDQWGT